MSFEGARLFRFLFRPPGAFTPLGKTPYRQFFFGTPFINDNGNKSANNAPSRCYLVVVVVYIDRWELYLNY